MVGRFQVGGSSWWYTEYRPARPQNCVKRTDRALSIVAAPTSLKDTRNDRDASRRLSNRVEPSGLTVHSRPAVDKMRRFADHHRISGTGRTRPVPGRLRRFPTGRVRPVAPNASLTGYQRMASIESGWRSARTLDKIQRISPFPRRWDASTDAAWIDYDNFRGKECGRRSVSARYPVSGWESR